MKETHQEKDRLGILSKVSHEIRTPLNGIIGISDLLQNATSKEEQQEYLQILKHTSENLLELANNMLDFSRIKSGKLQILNKEFDLRTTISRSLYGEKIKARAKGLDLEIAIDDTLPGNLVGDSVKIGQVFTNLVSNAIKFTHKGNVKISLQVLELHTGHVSIKASITDTGIGIRKEQLDHIFEEYNQGDEDINIKYSGTGLGLSICQKLIELLGGEISVKSKLGKGSTFSFWLTLERTETAHPEETITFQELTGEETAEGIRVLLVEDNKINVLVAKKYLERWGVNFQIALNGREALEKVQQQDFDLVLMDLQMPVMDGFIAAKTMRGHGSKKLSKMPIIALTASTESFYRKKIKAAGITDFITKPFHPDELLQKIIFHKRKGEKNSVEIL